MYFVPAIALPFLAAAFAQAQTPLLPVQQPASGGPEAGLAMIDTLPLDRMCSTRGALQYDFGSTDIPPSISTIPGSDVYKAPDALRPFTGIAIDGTKWSRRFYRAEYKAQVADKAAGTAMVQRLAARIRERGWIEKAHAEGADGPMIDPPPSPGEARFYSAASAMEGARRQGVRISIEHWGGQLILECTDMALMADHGREVFGDLPEGTPRPVPPATPRPTALDPAICATPEGRAGIEGHLGNKSQPMMRYVLERTSYGDRIVTWKSDRLKKSGKVSSKRMLDLAMSGLRGGSAGGDPLAGLSAITAMLRHAAAYDRLARAGDPEGACRSAISLFKQFGPIERTTMAQWAAMEKALDDEAKRVGVSWD
ncbi:hypothetical protein [Sphingomonas koreensis]